VRITPIAALLLVIPLSGCFGLGHHTVPTDYLGSGYSKWHIEVDFASGQRPDDSLLTFLHDRLAPLAHKAEGVDFQTDDALSDESRSWDDGAIQDYAKAHASFTTGGNQVVTHLMFLSGHYAGDSSNGKVLGVTYDYDLIVMFPQTISSSCTLATLCTSATPMLRASTLHEFGHALGLVNRGVAMVHPHEDSGHKGHSTNSASVMYWQVESSDIASLLASGGTIPQDFDANDREDLHAAGGV